MRVKLKTWIYIVKEEKSLEIISSFRDRKESIGSFEYNHGSGEKILWRQDFRIRNTRVCIKQTNGRAKNPDIRVGGTKQSTGDSN